MTAQVEAGIDFRRALSHYPTGVTLIAASGPGEEPVALIVGTFTSVSLAPPLVGFLVDRRSTTWPLIRQRGRFSASVLRADDEHVCRAFATKAEQRFDHLAETTSAGTPRLRDTALWVDCDIDDVLPAGDHEFVLGRVREVGIDADGGMPLIFLRGGYGAPQIASLQAEVEGLGANLELADVVRPEIEAVAADLGLECAVSVAINDSVYCIAAAGVGSATRDSGTFVGAHFPLAAPMAPQFVLGQPEEAKQAWLRSGSRLVGEDMTALGTSILETVAKRDHLAGTGRRASQRFQAFIGDASDDGSDLSFSAVLQEVAARGVDPGLCMPVEELTEVVSLHAPVRDESGRVVLCLDLLGLSGEDNAELLVQYRDRLVQAAQRATLLIGAHLPF
jgi:flavin reductase (DIM6/NTAB) family NADH-FMN oxidoreductase RutF/DNA-binding IclR family transcriptional regulator